MKLVFHLINLCILLQYWTFVGTEFKYSAIEICSVKELEGGNVLLKTEMCGKRSVKKLAGGKCSVEEMEMGFVAAWSHF